MRRTVHRPLGLLVLLFACLVTTSGLLAAEGGPGVLEVRVRDSWTGRALTGASAAASVEVFRAPAEGAIVLQNDSLESLLGDAQPVARVSLEGLGLAGVGAAEVPLAPGRYVFRASAEGYRPLYSYTTVSAGATAGNTLWLDPVEPPVKLSAQAVGARVRPGSAFFHGHVYDLASGLPLAGARVSLDETAVAASTDAAGYFRLHVPLPFELGAADFASDNLPPADTLRVEADGQRDHVMTGVLLVPGDRHFILDLEPGSGETLVDGRDKLQLSQEELIATDAKRLEGEVLYQGLVAGGEGLQSQASAATLLQVVNPPDSIRVGYANSGGTICCTGGCFYTYTFSLETYVRRGLTDEWIASWGQHSLRSGGPAYRSYGSWHVYNPKSGSYDICSNACCQVNDSDTSTNGNTATDRTAGILLQHSGSIFRSEYSAENNSWDNPSDGLSCVNVDLSCGNGWVGSPSTGWPCLNDTVALNQGCFGHGRGMSQWGTFRWDATYGRKWAWISDHYYNNNGSPSGNRSTYLTSPIQINSITPSPSSVNAGGSFTINSSVTSFAETNHSQVILGASLVSGGTTISDPARDGKVTIVPNGNFPSRTFVVPGGTANGTYNLVFKLWLDVNENNSVDADDIQLATFTSTSAVTVGGGGPGPGPWSQTIDDSDPACGLHGPTQWWWQVFGLGQNGQMRYTFSEPSSGTNFVYWNFSIPSSGNYKFEVFIPRDHATTQSAYYYLHNGSSWLGPWVVNQNSYFDQWVTLATVPLTAGTRTLYVGDVTGEPSGSRKVGVDAARATRQ